MSDLDAVIYNVTLRHAHDEISKRRKIPIVLTSAGYKPTHKELLTGRNGLQMIFQPLKNHCRTEVLKFAETDKMTRGVDEVASPGTFVLELKVVDEISQETKWGSQYINWNGEVDSERIRTDGHCDAALTNRSSETRDQPTRQPLRKSELKYGDEGYEDEQLTEHDPLIWIVSDYGRRCFRMIAIALKINLRKADDLPQCNTSMERLHRLLVDWITEKGREATRGLLLKACRKASILGAVEMELSKCE